MYFAFNMVFYTLKTKIFESFKKKTEMLQGFNWFYQAGNSESLIEVDKQHGIWGLGI